MSNIKKAATNTFLVLLAIAFLWFLGCLSGQHRTDHQPNITKDPVELLRKIKTALPDGQVVSFDDFRKSVGDADAIIVSWAKPISITRTQDHYVAPCQTGSSVSNGKVTVKVDSQVVFDMTARLQTLNLRNVTGVNASLGGGFDAAKVKEVTLTANADGSVNVSGKAQVSVFLPELPFDFTVSAADLPKD